MKYLPLVWAALWRRPTRLILTLLSVTVAFVLFGLMIGIDASYAKILEAARMDRLYVSPRFGGKLPLALRDQLANLDGVKAIGVGDAVFGYYRDPRNSVVPVMIDQGMRGAWPDMPLTPAQFDQLQASRTGVFITRRIAARLGLKAGDALPVLGGMTKRQDGSKTWPFTVLGVVDESPQGQAGLVIGDYDYLDAARSLADRGTVLQFWLLLKDPAQASQMASRIDALNANSANPTRSFPEKTLYESNSQAGLDIPFVTETVAGAGLFMILLLTANVISQSVRERIPEFAVLKTLGFSDLKVLALVFTEAALPCLLGAIIGLALATEVVALLPGLALPPGMGVPIPYMSPTVFGLAVVLAAMVALVSAMIPVVRIRRLNVAAALSGLT